MASRRPSGTLGRDTGTTNGLNATTRSSGRMKQKELGTRIIIEELEEVQDEKQARECLEKALLMVPAGQIISHNLLSTTLHQISAIQGTPQCVTNAIRSVAFLLDEMEENIMLETIRDAVNAQLNEMCSDLKAFSTDITQKIDERISKKMEELSTATKSIKEAAVTAAANRQNDNTQAPRSNPHHPYHPNNPKEALIRPPPHADPRLAAKEGIRIRQYMLEGADKNSKLGNMNAAELKTTINKALKESAAGPHQARSAVQHKKSNGILIEMESDAGAMWLKSAENRHEFCSKLEGNYSIKNRPYNILIHNVPTNFEPTNPNHIKELCEVNKIANDKFLGARWVKPPKRRENHAQLTAHLLITLSDIDDANRAILDGLTICNRRLQVEKRRKEPIRCMKCQRWGHIAGECLEKEDTCRNCGGKGHWTKDCTNGSERYCVSCNAEDHASWSRYCPIFLRKKEEMDKRTPENKLVFYPSTEPWTWSPDTNLSSYKQTFRQDLTPPPIMLHAGSQRERNEGRAGSTPSGRPYERRSWNRPTTELQPSNHNTDKPPFPHPTLKTIPKLTNEAEPANSQDFYD